MKIALAYVEFAGSPGKEYAYLRGALLPLPGQHCVVQTNEGKLKIVRCLRIADEEPSTHYTYKDLYGVILTQPTDAASLTAPASTPALENL